MVRVAHLRAPEQQLDPSFPRAAESQFEDAVREERDVVRDAAPRRIDVRNDVRRHAHRPQEVEEMEQFVPDVLQVSHREDRKSTRLNSSHLVISYAVFCLKKKK